MTNHDTNDTNKMEQGDHSRRRKRHGFFFGLVAGGAMGALIAGAVATAGPVLAARAFHRGFQGDPERAIEHVQFATAWVLDRVDASEAQKTEAERIASDAVNAILPLAATHRENREALANELTRASVDREAIERIRRSEMELADGFSREAMSALTALAETLTPEQRAELLEMAREHHRHE